MTQPDPDAVYIAAVAAQTGLTEDAVRAVMEAQNDPALVGPPAGTIQRDPVTGDVAVRCGGIDATMGRPFWWTITQQDSSCTKDLNPTKEWPDITPAESDA